MTELLALVLSLFWVYVAYLIRGFVLSWLWLWFAVPLGLPAISIPLAIGISLIVGFLTGNPQTCKDDRTESEIITQSLIFTVVAPFGILLVGFIVKSFL